ncbi:L-methionine/branched-chain amino acid transporter [Gammaproteobacteria bacterium]|nr:L-methionine/branched-chain amino acid transporter [Gammaproteobacteria bacterium]
MTELRREITRGQGIALMVTTLLGTGAFAVPALAAAAAGYFSLWSWLTLMVLMMPIAMCFAWLGTRYPHAGGTAHWVELAFGRRAGKATAWVWLFVIPIGLPVAAEIAVSYFIALTGFDGPRWVAMVAIILLVLGINLLAARTSGGLQTAIAISIAATLVALLVASGIDASEWMPPPPAIGDALPMVEAAALILWCFVGVEAIAHLGGELRDPERDFRWVIGGGLLLTGLAYYATAVMVLHHHAYGDDARNARSIAEIAAALWGPNGERVIGGVAFLACLASMNLYVFSFSRLVYSLAAKGELPPSLTRLNRAGVPTNAVGVVALLFAIGVGIAQFGGLSLSMMVGASDAIFVAVYLLAVLAATRLLVGHRRAVAVLATAIAVVMMLSMGFHVWYLALLSPVLWWLAQPRRASADSPRA